jgi:hypothetical protein
MQRLNTQIRHAPVVNRAVVWGQASTTEVSHATAFHVVLVPIPGDDLTTPTPLPFVITDRSSGTGSEADFEKSRRCSLAVYFSTITKNCVWNLV